ncbi:DUF4232 domain-containing protein [Nocardioides sp. GXZ039]|uniref:DUF4232 domain-containing protein n=1 Tax=Nocardioides sp. GXZ039 TaxID=3136018 RepID=UPI0030F44C1C
MMRKLALTLAATAALAAGGTVATVVPSGASTPADSTASAAVTPACVNADLKASYRARDAGAGHQYGVIRLRNVSDHACTTGGYGGLSYVGGGDGTQIGAAADRDKGKVRTIVLQPGQRAVSLVDAVDANNYPRRTCRPRAVDGFRVYIPNETVSQFVKHRTVGCANTDVHLLGHKPYRKAG